MRTVVAVLALASLAAAKDPKVELGRRLFMDPAVSRSGKFSCSSCHDPEHGFSDPRIRSRDENGETRRHSQPVVDVAEGDAFHWDGEFGSVRDLLTARLGSRTDAAELAHLGRSRAFACALTDGRQPDTKAFRAAVSDLPPTYFGAEEPAGPSVALRLDEQGLYARGFLIAFGAQEVTTERLIEALLRYVHSLRSTRSPFDRFCAGDEDALDPAQQRGFELFIGKADCVACHTIDPGDDCRPRLTDDRFHNTGVAFRTLEAGVERAIVGSPPDGGAGEMSFVARDRGKFKTPSLRDVARRPPYMHDGSLRTLEEVVRYYDRGGTPNRHLDERIAPLDLSEDEIRDVVAFLGALTGWDRAGIGPPVARWIGIHVVDLAGDPLPGLPVRIVPAGDRLEGGRPGDRPLRLRTDAWGHLVFRFPAWTHIRLESPGFDYDRLIPDYVTRAKVIAAPRDLVALRVRGLDFRRFARLDVLPRLLCPPLARFRFLRKISSGEALYVAEPRWSLPWTTPRPVTASILGANLSVDLSGGWTDPLDLN